MVLENESVTGWLRAPLSAALAMLLVVVAAYHARLGLQVVVEDYVHGEAVKLALLVAVRFACLGG